MSKKTESKVTFDRDEQSKHYQEVEARLHSSKENGKLVIRFEILSVKRPKVKIQPHEARTLNEGVAEGGNKFASVYLLPTQKSMFTADEIEY